MEMFTQTYKMIQKNVETYLSDSYDPIALLLCMHLIYRYQVIANKRNVPIMNKLHSILIQLFETRFEVVMKANIDSVQRVEPHKFSSIELNPHFVRDEREREREMNGMGFFFFFSIRRSFDVMRNFPVQ